MKNRAWIVDATPQGAVRTDHFRLEERPMPVAGSGQLLLRNRMLSIAPAQVAWLKAASYRPQVKPGEIMPSGGLGEVIQSEHPDFAVGDIVEGPVEWQDYAVVDAASVRKRDKARPLDLLLALTGGSGLTAYYGMLEVGRIRAGETVLVSAAAGAVGNIAVQIARLAGCRVVGIAGGAEKCRWLVDEYKLDAAVDYKAADFAEALAKACPEGVDFFFDNVGGSVLETALAVMKTGGRIGLCGIVGQLDGEPDRSLRGVPYQLIIRRISMTGFLLSDFTMQQRLAAGAVMRGWVADGRLRVPVHEYKGLENAPAALVALMAGENRGKMLVRL